MGKTIDQLRAEKIKLEKEIAFNYGTRFTDLANEAGSPIKSISVNMHEVTSHDDPRAQFFLSDIEIHITFEL